MMLQTLIATLQEKLADLGNVDVLIEEPMRSADTYEGAMLGFDGTREAHPLLPVRQILTLSPLSGVVVLAFSGGDE